MTSRPPLREALRLLLVTDDAVLVGHDPVALCRGAVAGGVTAVQLRLKRATDRDFADLARRLVAAIDVPLFINDRLDIALLVGAAGVHLGPDDLSPAAARRVVPADLWIGASVGSEVEMARGEAADYWGIGPLRGTITKGDAGAPLGLAAAARLLAGAGRRPCVAIGGVEPGDVGDVVANGFAGVAVVRGILAADDVTRAARAYAMSFPVASS